jgi:hypothetical protein
MSAPVAGKFQDHYVVLGVEPTAGAEAIQIAYARLAQQFHPHNPETGDREKFDAVNLAYEVLSQPELRGEFDKLKGVAKESVPKFSGRPFFTSLGDGAGLRAALLCVLYDRRKQKPFTPSLSVRHVENIIAATPEAMTLALWYLKERQWVISDDKSSLQITVSGIDYVERNPPSPEVVMPYIKPSGLMTPEAAEPGIKTGAEADNLPQALDDTAGPWPEEESYEAGEEAAPVNVSPTVEDPQRRANLNRILSRGNG